MLHAFTLPVGPKLRSLVRCVLRCVRAASAVCCAFCSLCAVMCCAVLCSPAVLSPHAMRECGLSARRRRAQRKEERGPHRSARGVQASNTQRKRQEQRAALNHSIPSVLLSAHSRPALSLHSTPLHTSRDRPWASSKKVANTPNPPTPQPIPPDKLH